MNHWLHFLNVLKLDVKQRHLTKTQILFDQNSFLKKQHCHSQNTHIFNQLPSKNNLYI